MPAQLRQNRQSIGEFYSRLKPREVVAEHCFYKGKNEQQHSDDSVYDCRTFLIIAIVYAIFKIPTGGKSETELYIFIAPTNWDILNLRKQAMHNCKQLAYWNLGCPQII